MTRCALILCLVLTATTASANDQTPNDQTTAIRKVLRAAETSWNAGDIPGYMASYWHSDKLRFASGGRVSFGWQPVLDGYLARYPDRAAMGELHFDDLEVKLTGPEYAVAFGRWRLVRAADEPHGLFTLILRRFPAGWRIVHDHTSSARE